MNTKRLTALLTLLAIVAFVRADDAAPASLLKNGDFAAGTGTPTDWTLNATGQGVKVDKEAHPEGIAQSLRVDIKTVAESQGTVSQPVKGFKPGAKLLLTAQLKGTAGRLGNLSVKLKKDGKEVRRVKTDWNTTEWAEYKLEIDTTDADSLTVECRFAQGEKAKDQTVWFANVKLVESK